MTRRHELQQSVEIDGGGGVTLDGAGATAMFWVPAGKTLKLRGLTVRGGVSRFILVRGSRIPNGGVASGPGAVELSAVRTTGCTNPYDVGSIVASERASFEDNVGSWVLRARRATLTGVVFSGNQGGALIDARQPVNLPQEATLERVDIHGGRRPVFWSGRISIRRSAFTNNGDLQADGGALSLGGDSSVETSTFTNNRAKQGGAIWLRNGSLRLRGGTFEGNRAETFGGAIAAGTHQPPIVMELAYSKFRRNEARAGGAVSLQDSPGPANRLAGAPLLFTSNAASVDGGAIYAPFGKIQLGRAIFVKNRAGSSGGAIFGSQSQTSSVALGNALIVQNSALGGGGYFGRKLDLRNSTIAENDGGGLVQASFTVTPGGVGTIRLVNSIVSGNRRGNCTLTTVLVGQNNLQHPGVDCGSWIRAIDPLLDSFFVPNPQSPARGSGDLDTCRNDALVRGRDVYGAERPAGTAGCTIGAVERDLEQHAVRLLRESRELPDPVRRFLEFLNILRPRR